MAVMALTDAQIRGEECMCGCPRTWTKYGWLCLHCDLKVWDRHEREVANQ